MIPLSRTIAAWTSGFHDGDLPAVVFDSTRLRLLDIIGCMIGAAAHPDTVACGKAATDIFPGTQTRAVPLAGPTSLAGAALINGTAALVLEFDDSHLESAVHPSSPVVAASLPIAHVTGLTAGQLIAAIAIGTEMACRLGLAAVGRFHQNGFHPTGIFGAFGAIYAAARCLQFDDTQTMNAAGLGGSVSSGLMASWEDGSGAKSLHAGFSACAAINAAYCARSGVTGPAGVYDGRFGFFKAHVQDKDYPFDFSRVVEGLGETWEALKVAPKAYPCGHYIQPLVDAALELRRAHKIDPDRIAQVTCWMPAHVIPLVAEPLEEKRRPRTTFHARFSLQHSMAEAMLAGTLDKSSFQEANLADPRINGLADKVNAVVDTLVVDRSRLGGRVDVRLGDGRVVSYEVEHMRGMPRNPMTTEDIARKFRLNTADAMPLTKADRLMDTILSWRADSSIAPLFDQL